jgi:hypothetical protein
MTKISDALTYGLTIRESANDGSDFTNPVADYRRLFLGEDGKLHLRDSAGTVTDTAAAGDITTDAAWAAKGDLIVGTANNTAAVLTAGTNGKVLMAASGEATGLKWETAGGGGALVLLEQHTGAASATLDFTTCITSTYDDYQIELVNVLPATDSQQLVLRFSTDAGTNYVATGYQWNHMYSYAANTSAWEGSTSDTGICVGGGAVTNSGPGVCGTIRFHGPLLAGTVLRCVTMDTTRYVSAVTNIVHDTPSMGTLSAAPVDALRFLFSSGNVASGTIRVYGVAKS